MLRRDTKPYYSVKGMTKWTELTGSKQGKVLVFC